jgi:hypothetical protein
MVDAARWASRVRGVMGSNSWRQAVSLGGDCSNDRFSCCAPRTVTVSRAWKAADGCGC